MADATPIEDLSLFAKNQRIPNRAQRLRNYPGIAARVLLQRLPHLLVTRLTQRGLVAKCVRHPLAEAERSVERLNDTNAHL